eukprot:gb/GFBE01083130.1/.p1 GENE.gb/GFBE01083130.1/~~gb/GFBE01083130.1/.p1  ORF type:complete len:334 (+),score=56.40 gb/GFBE01083130.1/:1-1002(+)
MASLSSAAPDNTPAEQKFEANGAGSQAHEANSSKESYMDQFLRRNRAMESAEAVAYGRSFTPRPTDIFVVTYPKSGTTWVTQICHQLRTGGDMDFDEMFEVCPWDVHALDAGYDLNDDHKWSKWNPRVFKSHEKAEDIAQGAKYIHVCREPEDAAISFYKFLPAFLAMPDGCISIEEFVNVFFGGFSHSGGPWDFLVGWWERRNDPNVLWVSYEDLLSDIESQIKRIAAFMNVTLDDAKLQRVKDFSSHEYMTAHKNKFDEHLLYEKIRGRMGIPEDFVHGTSKVSSKGGKTGGGQQLPLAIREMFGTRWREVVQARTGLPNYDEMRNMIQQL